MSAELERRWDDAVETAWREFRQRLADHVAAMAEDESLVVELSGGFEDGAAPYCQVLAGPGVLRVEAVSNAYLASSHELDETQEEALVALDFCPPETMELPGETNFFVDVEQRDADRVAVMLVRALREVYGVLHPVYLEAEGLEPEGAVRPLPPEPRKVDPGLEAVVRPTSVTEVQELVDLAVADLYDDALEWDDDGDLPLPTRHGWVWVIVSTSSPRVLLSAPLVEDVVDERRALTELNLLNQREFGLSFALREGRITVMREIDLAVTVASRLRAEVERLTTQVDGWASDLIARVGGRFMDETSVRQPAGEVSERPTGSRFATAYAVMVELERGQRGSVGPATMARIFENDTGLLLKAVRITEQRRREMREKARQARREGRTRDENVARARQEYMRGLAARMRAALRLIVDAPVRKVQLDQLALFDEDEAGTTR